MWVSTVLYGAGGAVMQIGRYADCDKAQHLMNSISKDLICPSTSQRSTEAIPSLSLGLRNLFLGIILSVT